MKTLAYVAVLSLAFISCDRHETPSDLDKQTSQSQENGDESHVENGETKNKLLSRLALFENLVKKTSKKRYFYNRTGVKKSHQGRPQGLRGFSRGVRGRPSHRDECCFIFTAY